MNDLGITVLRFRDEEIYYHIDSVLRDIEKFIDDFEKKQQVFCKSVGTRL